MDSSLLHAIEFVGFRAYLQPQTIELKCRNLAIFAPNGHGKSSVADGIEFYLSAIPSLPRLGEKAVGNQTGPTALAHCDAAKAGVVPSVTLRFKTPRGVLGERRLADGRAPRTPSGDFIAEAHRVDPVVRGYSLRSFVEDTKPDERYTLISEWLSLSKLVEAQKCIRALKSYVSTDVRDSGVSSAVDRQLGRLTNAVVSKWNVEKIQSWLRSTFLNDLGLGESSIELTTNSALHESLKSLVRGTAAAAGLSALKQEIVRVENARSSVASLKGALGAADAALEIERAERELAANSAFNEVWKAALPLLAAEQTAPDLCPVCATEWKNTTLGSRESVRISITECLASLQTYEVARLALSKAENDLQLKRQIVQQTLTELTSNLPEADLETKPVCQAVITLLGGPNSECSQSDIEELEIALQQKAEALTIREAAAQQKQDEEAPSKALSTLNEILALAADLDGDSRQRNALEKIAHELDKQGTSIAAAIRQHISELLEELRSGTNDIYRAIQGADAAQVRLELPKEVDKIQNRLNITIDFAQNRKSVAPAGYLSDSQLHSVALAFRLAAIRRFNIKAPFVVLDDVATSYDADYRRQLVAALGNQMIGCQLIVLTHDQRFFSYLREMLPTNHWEFKKITALDPTFGPRLSTHLVKDAEIENFWAGGLLAANLIRQAEDETLLRWAQDFGVDIRIRPTAKPFDYGRAELADALARFFKGVGLTPPLVPGISNAFLDSLRDGNVENFGSHFQETQWGAGSIGDEKARWTEFQAFRDAFKCPSCAGRRFKRPFGMRFPVCARGNCETQFQFTNSAATSREGSNASASTKTSGQM